jgi:hypothetical protein
MNPIKAITRVITFVEFAIATGVVEKTRHMNRDNWTFLVIRLNSKKRTQTRTIKHNEVRMINT